jgi:hypothetical protein
MRERQNNADSMEPGMHEGASQSSEVQWLHDWDEALQRARAERRLMLVDVEKDN